MTRFGQLTKTGITFEHQADAALTQTNPVSATLYTVLGAVARARIYSIAVQCTWTVQPSPLEIIITIDGQSIVFAQTNPVSGTWYYVRFKDPRYAPSAQGFSTALTDTTNQAFQIEGRSVKVEARVTGGTVSQLAARAIYAKR